MIKNIDLPVEVKFEVSTDEIDFKENNKNIWIPNTAVVAVISTIKWSGGQIIFNGNC